MLREALGGDAEVVKRLAEALVDAALKGNVTALKELLTRLESEPESSPKVIVDVRWADE